MREGGCNWWNFQTGQGWPSKYRGAVVVTEGGKWLGVVTPQGRIQVIDTKTGKKALVDPKPSSPTPIEHLAFMGKSSILLALDAEGYLMSYDLSKGIIEGSDGEDIIQINSVVHRMQGLHGGEIAILLLRDDATPAIGQLLVLPLKDLSGAVLLEDIPLTCSINPKTGSILQPAPANAALEEQIILNNKVLLFCSRTHCLPFPSKQ